MEIVETIPEEIKKIGDRRKPNHYFDKFREIWAEVPGRTKYEAYILLEELHESWFGYERYSSFQSFKTCYYRSLNRKKQT